jgi:hypothetical protein
MSVRHPMKHQLLHREENFYMKNKKIINPGLTGNLKIFLLLISLAISPFHCAQEVDSIYERLNTPLGLTVEVHSDGDGHLVSFYGDNKGKLDFYGYALYQGAAQDESRFMNQEVQAIEIFQVDANRDVDLVWQFKMGGTPPASGIPHSDKFLTAGYFLTVRAFPVFPLDRKDNQDPLKGPTVSHPSNTVVIPPL